MPTLPSMNSLGKLCSSSRSKGVDRVRVKRNNSVKRMSIIEDGHVAEVLYLIPKQYMQHLPNINPNEYYLSERLNDVATGSEAVSGSRASNSASASNWPQRKSPLPLSPHAGRAPRMSSCNLSEARNRVVYHRKYDTEAKSQGLHQLYCHKHNGSC
ncbi:hypothetical protein KUCAC02_024474, partial [Chaenocephalus aceratus]